MDICICGYACECDGQCAGALAQRAECAELDHSTPRKIAERRGWELPPSGPSFNFDFCERCGVDLLTTGGKR